jgi:PST family polysaccharide transporter
MSQFSNTKVVTATKWSTITELLAKLVSPITTMVLARILAPEAFGVLVTVTMVISFAEIFTDAGFQKYLIQHEFNDDEDKYQTVTTAFWANLILSICIWVVIIIFADPIATIVGNPGKGNVISFSCVCIPLAAFSSIQFALYKRNFDFKTLFSVRLVATLIPVVITIPLALITKNYWALVVGMVCLNVSNAILLTIKSPWKPYIYFNWTKLKAMLSFSIWSVLEAISIWLTNYVDVFIVGTILSQHYLGVYKTSMSIVAQIMAIITASTTPVLYASLSRLQNSPDEYNTFFLKFQRIVSIIIIPMGVGIYLFRHFITSVLLGNQWYEAAGFIGLWALTSSIVIVLSYYTSEVTRSKGKPSISFFSQVLHLCFLVPTIIFAAKYGFEILYTARSLVRLQAVIVDVLILYFLTHITPIKVLKNIFVPFIAAAMMAVLYTLLPSVMADSIVTNITYIVLCGVVYFMVLSLFPKERSLLKNVISQIKSKL